MTRLLAVFFIFIFIPFVEVEKKLQVTRIALSASGSPQFRQERPPRTPEETRIERDQMKRMNEERQRRLKEDTDKLLKLATELKEYVDKTNENILSLDVIKKSEEIEKLAKSVREKMKISYATEDELQHR